MKIEDNRKNEEIKHLKDIEIGQCFEDALGRIYIKTDEECKDGYIKVLYIRNGYLANFIGDVTVTPVNAKVVIENDN